ncbi:hypothetical protein [Chryseobacterium sp.]|uniref:hypothetical protein n=1 Tax=Chryseobacterium sp. TaxID=1871047 RepID=UPI002FCAC92D
MNFVTVIYIINVLLYTIYFFGKSGSEVDMSGVDYTISGIMSLLLILAGYVNAKKKMTYRSVLWVFFVNVLLFIMSGLFDQFGNDFNLFSTAGSNSFMFTLALIAYNAFAFPLIVVLEGSGFSLVVPLLLSFILTSLGYLIGVKMHSQNRS